MDTKEIRNILEKDIRPKYGIEKEYYIEECMKLKNKYRELVKKVREGEIEHKIIWGEYNKQTFRYEGGFLNELSKEQRKLIDENRNYELKEVTEFYNKKFEKQINNLLDSIINNIYKYNPKSVEIGDSDHDFNFILGLEKKKRSFTINTIIAGGDIQCVHYRTLKKLHKEVI